MKSIGKFMLISYANSILETIGLLSIPLIGIFAWSAWGAWMAVGAVTAVALAAGMGFAILREIEAMIAEDHANEKRLRER